MKKERTLGKAGKRRYDIPLNRGAGTGFLMVIIGLMTFLGILTMALSFTLSAMTHRWTSGLENRLTIEIPAQTSNGKLLDRNTIEESVRDIAASLDRLPGVKSTHTLDNGEISSLIEPWLGKDVLKGDIPIPGIIAVETSRTDTQLLQNIHNRITSINPDARMDTHEEWLSDLLRFTGTLRLGALILVAVIGMATITAVSGAVRARLAINREEIEILHLMGANDRYITRQFQRHSFILALRGGIAGAIAAVVALLLIGWAAGEMDAAILPGFRLAPLQIAMLALAPMVAAIIAIAATRQTVLKTLATFP